ncbi:pyridoxamine 5'-phosphate oxidase family protein [Jannaschia seohaensis]|uniref:Pyridoxamine 5'-phosphate oxidase N-terminal domain-containing protein n=1 Tax=Jannaschia seohaensis TaxID=475081 RepID=A0A2Y9APK6_9RHOB|nr:pyridoxamine 5'-phosphate oxidase family protein [Jannaschia seohaensis]PWJ20327.1 hypothetical protein BCF38_103142 [Jannaschia seohaensis]SSA44367.1 hypothetical protein SAMN05421539_103142 [Jannaschia seohaensis]
MPNAYADIAFTRLVREEQQRLGSAETYARVLSPERNDGAELGPRETAFLKDRDGVYQATVSETGWPYVQFRGGARGFLKVIDKQTVGYADYRGNRQYISLGNLRHDDRVSIIAVDYARRERLKLWGHVRITEDPKILDLLNGVDGPLAERGVIVRIAAFDWNCPKHIPLRLTEDERDGEIARLTARISDLEEELAWKAGVLRDRIA